MYISAKRTTAIIPVAVVLCLTFAAGPLAAPPDRAAVTFRAGAGGTLTAAVDGVPIVSGDSVGVGKSVAFTAIPAAGYGIAYWTVNGAAVADTSMRTLLMGISNAAPVDVAVSFERTSPCAAVTFRAEGGGALTASVDGVPISSGDSVGVGKNIVFTAVPPPGTALRWTVNGSAIADTSLVDMLIVGISNTAPVNVAVSFKRTSPCAAVTFRAEANGKVTAVVDGVPISSGDSVDVGKNVVFTAVPAAGYVIARWRSNETEIADTSTRTLIVGISNTTPVDVAVSFEKYVEPPDTSTVPLSGVLTFGPSPVRSGGEVAIFWDGNKEIGGELLVFNALGDKVDRINVNGVGKIGAWDTRGVVKGTYLMRGMLRDKDGFKCRVLMLVGVVR